MKKVRSFDLFDTLIGRLHFFPHSTFELVEKNFPFPGFAFLRQTVHGTLPDIYRELRRMFDLTEQQAEALMEFEFQTDLDQIFPISETLSQVQDGDLIVSDTFYDLSQIKKILKKIGLKKKVKIYATPAGKYFGTIWDVVKKKHRLSSHLGDSMHSDVEIAKKNQILGEHYTGSTPTAVEKAMIDFGQSELGSLMRALRLQNPYPAEMAEHRIWNDQCQLNVPLLIQASLYLRRLVDEKKKTKILFTARDGCLWIQIFRTLFPQYECVYFHSSRFTYLHPTLTFIEYVKSTYNDDSIIVDSNGSGRSCIIFFERHIKTAPLYFSIVNSKESNHTLLRKDLAREGIEKLNYDLVGALYDVRDGKDLRTSPEYDLRFIHPSHACIEKCVELLPSYTIDVFNQQIVDWAVIAMEGRLEIDQHVQHATVHAHVQDREEECIHLLSSGFLFKTFKNPLSKQVHRH